MKSLLRRLWKPALVLVPFFVGLAGFLMEGEPLLQSMFNCVCLYTLNYQDPPANLLIEAARWLAPLATASTFILIITALRIHLQAAAARWSGDSVAVWGDGMEKDAVLEQLDNRGIPLVDAPIRAHSYILLGSESENLSYYQRYRTLLQDHNVYLKCSNLPEQASTDPRLHLFCPEETAARIFWTENFLYPESVAAGHRMKIVILGFGKLGKELLLSALQRNIFHPNQMLEYHIFGDPGSFPAVYPQLPQISDPVIFHKESWYESLPLLEEANMVIVAAQEDQLALLRDLTHLLPRRRFHVLTAEPHGTAVLAAQSELVCFDWKSAALELENIRGTQRHLYAKRLHLRYTHLYGGVEENAENLELCWNTTNAFNRYSSINSSDYFHISKQILAVENQADYRDPVWLERLAELEHIRWCRYHYLNNWCYGVPENGKSKDADRRIHICLRDYQTLPEAEKEKDRENIRLLFQLDQEG